MKSLRRGLLALLALLALHGTAEAQYTTMAGVNPDTMPTPVFSKKAIEFLEAQYAMRPKQEFLGCMLGFVASGHVYVQRIVLAPGQKGDSNSVSFPHRSCIEKFDNVLGHIHSHTQIEQQRGDKCSYYHEVNGQRRWLQDLANFRYGPQSYVADAIYCGQQITWIDVGYKERVLHRHEIAKAATLLKRMKEVLEPLQGMN